MKNREIDNRLIILDNLYSERKEILKTIYQDYKKLQKTLPTIFPTRFRWITKLTHFNDYNLSDQVHGNMFNISFQIMKYKVSLYFDGRHYIIRLILMTDDKKTWTHAKENYFISIKEFQEEIEKFVRKSIPEYDKILLRIEKFSRLNID